MSTTATTTSTLEDYLEAISRLTRELGAARVRDIAKALDVHKSTVTSALKSLAEKGLVNYAPYEITTLTPEGRELALEVTRRHEVIRQFLIDVLCVDRDAADAHACRMEHVMDKDLLRRLALFAEFIRTRTRIGDDWSATLRFCLARGDAADEPNPPDEDDPHAEPQ